MPLRAVSPTSASAGTSDIPPCPKCLQSVPVRHLTLDHVTPGIEYWRCEACGFVWATEDGEDLRLRRA